MISILMWELPEWFIFKDNCINKTQKFDIRSERHKNKTKVCAMLIKREFFVTLVNRWKKYYYLSYNLIGPKGSEPDPTRQSISVGCIPPKYYSLSINMSKASYTTGS